MRSGGGQLESSISEKRDGQIHVVTQSCNGKTLNPAEQVQTQFILQGKLEADARAILDDKALIASEVAWGEFIPAGTWMNLSIVYEYKKFPGETLEVAKKEIEKPVIIINSQQSDVLREIELETRNVTEEICNN